MTEHLFLRVFDETLEWLLLDAASGIVRIRGAGDWNDLESTVRELQWEGETHVLVPGETVLFTSAVVPSRQARHVLQAIPFMVEEKLACDVEDCHFAAGDRIDGGAIRVAVVSLPQMKTWCERLSAAGISPTTMTADVQHVSRPARGVRVLVDGDRALLSGADGKLMAMEAEVLPVMATMVGDEGSFDLEVLVPHGEARSTDMLTSQIEAEHGELELTELDYRPFEHLCRSFDDSAIDLLQGEFRGEEKQRERGSGWRSVAVLAGCAFALHIMLLIVQGIYLDVKATQYEREARALYADVFPGDSDVRDLRRRWESRIRAGTGQGGEQFFDVFARAAQQIPRSNLRLENVNFNETRGDMSLQLMADQSSQFVRFSEALAGAGLDAEVGTISQAENGARGNIKIRTGP